jgi:hypothetical protein
LAAIACGWQMSFSEHSLQRASFAGGGSLPETSMARMAAMVSSTCRRNSGVIFTSRRRREVWW